jgi:hypothetical protein
MPSSPLHLHRVQPRMTTRNTSTCALTDQVTAGGMCCCSWAGMLQGSHACGVQWPAVHWSPDGAALQQGADGTPALDQHRLPEPRHVDVQVAHHRAPAHAEPGAERAGCTMTSSLHRWSRPPRSCWGRATLHSRADSAARITQSPAGIMPAVASQFEGARAGVRAHRRSRKAGELARWSSRASPSAPCPWISTRLSTSTDSLRRAAPRRVVIQARPAGTADQPLNAGSCCAPATQHRRAAPPPQVQQQH